MSYLEYKARRVVREAETGGSLTSGERDEIAGEIAGKGRNSDHNLKPCLQSELILTYWGALESVIDGQRFFNTKYFSSKWSLQAIHNPGGGVSRISLIHKIFSNYGCMIVVALRGDRQ